METGSGLSKFERTDRGEFKVYHLPHVKIAGRDEPCPLGYGVAALREIQVCKDCVSPELLPFIIRHEELECDYKLRDIAEGLPLSDVAVDQHGLANCVLYREASDGQQLDLLHREWNDVKNSAEPEDSREYRDKLYAYYRRQHLPRGRFWKRR